MYFRVGQFPELKRYSKRRQLQLLLIAIRRYGTIGVVRFWLVIALALASGLLSGLFAARTRSGVWPILFTGVFVGLLFYCYLLWEINFHFHRIVKRYFAVRAQARAARSVAI